MPLDVETNQEFLKFLSAQGEKKNLPNLELLINLERTFPGLFIRVMSNFDEAMALRDTLDDSGEPITVSWKKAFKKLYLHKKYNGVTKENEDIAELLGKKGLSQALFNEVDALRQEAQNENIPEHILGKPIKEETILDSIERIKTQTGQEILSGKSKIEELFDKKFTYEWLSKYDPHNAIIGIFCNCCATIISWYYGKEIAVATMRAPDVQNLVIRDAKGYIIAKGAVYVNKQKGYAVINDFEINRRYKKHECGDGLYSVEESSEEEQDREKIFKAFERGLNAFIEEYDRQNPRNPLQQINIGMSSNKLRKQVERYKKETVNLTVPYEYNFQDTNPGQYILYKRAGTHIEKEVRAEDGYRTN